jgi:hypothetical protein
MSKNRILMIVLAMCLVFGTVPFALGAAPQATDKVVISALYLGAPKEKPNQEYVKISNKGTNAVNLKGWKIKDDDAKHTYTFSSYVLKTKSTVTLKSGKGKNTATTLFWNKYSFIWNNYDPDHDEFGDTAYLYNSQNKLVMKLTKP